MAQICSVEGCGLPHAGHGFCNKHYMRAKARGELGFDQPKCTYEGCEKPLYAKGFCSGHYGKLKRNGTPDGSTYFIHRPCSIDGCEERATRRGWCGKHYQRWKVFGDPEYAVKEVSAKGAALSWADDLVSQEQWGEECIPWPFATDPNGYGRLNYYDGFLAHRYICSKIHGDSPFELAQVRHLCGNGTGGCVNPNHLKWGTAEENNHDRWTHKTDNRGTRHGMSKLTEEQVYEIRRRYDNRGMKETCEDIGLDFDTTHSHVSAIGRREAWSWLEEKK